MAFICPVCDNNEYEEMDGLYFCTLCSTQSKEMMTQEAEVSFDDKSRWFMKEIKIGKGKKRRQRDDYGRPWTIYEAYQFIIMAQAEAFINLGMNKDLMEITFSLWAHYLSKVGVAFCKREKVVPDIVVTTKCGRQRELHRGNLVNPINRNKRPLEDPEEHQNASIKRRKLLLTLQERELNEDGNVNESTNVEKDPDLKPSPSDTDNIIFVDESLGSASAYKMAMNSAEWMDLTKTIAISYLGVLVTDPHVIAADVISWIYEGKIPFLSTTHLLPSDMVMSGADAKLFGSVNIDAEQLIRSVNKMRHFIGISKMADPSISSLIQRFLKELDLPDKLLSVCIDLKRRATYSLTLYKTKYKKLEIPALLYIGLALKLLFGFDGTTERKLSSYSVRVKSFIKSDLKIFIFDEWKTHQIRKQYHKFDACSELTKSLLTSSHTSHPDKLLESYNNLRRDEIHFCWHKDYICTRKQQKFRSQLRYPLSQAIKRQEKEAEQTRSSECDIDKDGHHFRQSSLLHISDFSEFKRNIHGKLTEKDLNSLEREINYISSNILYTDFTPVDDEDALLSSRPKSFIWLLKVFSRLADCSVLVFDKGMINMQEQIKAYAFGKKPR